LTQIEIFGKKPEVVPHINLAEDHYAGEIVNIVRYEADRFESLSVRGRIEKSERKH